MNAQRMSLEVIEVFPVAATDEAEEKGSDKTTTDKEGSWLKMRVWLPITVALLVAVYLITVVVLAAL